MAALPRIARCDTKRNIDNISEFASESVANLDYFYGGATQAQDTEFCSINPLCPTFPQCAPGR